MGDNRNYEYLPSARAQREEFSAIADWIPEASRVLDLGCGEGSLMELLVQKKKARVEGLEISASGVEVCQGRGLNVRQGRIDEKLPWPDNFFDVVVCNVTLQMVMHPETLLNEMARLAPRQIVSFPNFANIRNRLELLFCGRMPRAMLFGHRWWNTGHIHQLSLIDFEEVLAQAHLRVIKKTYFGRLAIPIFTTLAPNLFSTLVLLQTERSPAISK